MTEPKISLVEKIKVPTNKEAILFKEYNRYCAKRIFDENFDPTGAQGINICSRILEDKRYSDVEKWLREMEILYGKEISPNYDFSNEESEEEISPNYDFSNKELKKENTNLESRTSQLSLGEGFELTTKEEYFDDEFFDDEHPVLDMGKLANQIETEYPLDKKAKYFIEFYKEGSVLNRNSYGSDLVRKIKWLTKYFPNQFGENGKQPISSKDPNYVGKIFSGVITSYEKKYKRKKYI